MPQPNDEQRLVEKLAKIEALFARPGSDGERAAAGNARDRILDALARFERREPALEQKFSMPDAFAKRLFVALLRRYEIRPYRYRGQRHTTVMARMTASFTEQVLWPEFQELHTTLWKHLDEVTTRVIEAAIHGDADQEEEERAALA